MLRVFFPYIEFDYAIAETHIFWDTFYINDTMIDIVYKTMMVHLVDAPAGDHHVAQRPAKDNF